MDENLGPASRNTGNLINAAINEVALQVANRISASLLQEVAGTKERKGKSWSSRRRRLRYFEINDWVCTIRLPTCWIMGGGMYVADSVEDKLSCSSRTGEKKRGLE